MKLHYFRQATDAEVPRNSRSAAESILSMVKDDLGYRLPIQIEWLAADPSGALATDSGDSMNSANTIGLRADLSLAQIGRELAFRAKRIALSGKGALTPADDQAAAIYAEGWKYRGNEFSQNFKLTGLD